MPLHDWKDDRGWDSVHLVWLAQLLDWVQPRLPEGYRAYLGSVPALTVDVPNGRPDMSVRNWPTAAQPAPVAPRDAGSSVPMPPSLERWRLTGFHRIVPASTNKQEFEKI